MAGLANAAARVAEGGVGKQRRRRLEERVTAVGCAADAQRPPPGPPRTFQNDSTAKRRGGRRGGREGGARTKWYGFVVAGALSSRRSGAQRLLVRPVSWR